MFLNKHDKKDIFSICPENILLVKAKSKIPAGCFVSKTRYSRWSHPQVEKTKKNITPTDKNVLGLALTSARKGEYLLVQWRGVTYG